MGADNLLHLFNIITGSFSSIHSNNIFFEKNKKKIWRSTFNFKSQFFYVCQILGSITPTYCLMRPKELRQDIIFSNIIFCNPC